MPPTKEVTKIFEGPIQADDTVLQVTLYDTPGFGDTLDIEGTWAPVVATLEDRFREYQKLMAQLPDVNEHNALDPRVHILFYFITGPRYFLPSPSIYNDHFSYDLLPV